MEETVYNALVSLRVLFSKLHFLISTLPETERFQKDSKVSVFISGFERFSVDDRQKRIKKHELACSFKRKRIIA